LRFTVRSLIHSQSMDPSSRMALLLIVDPDDIRLDSTVLETTKHSGKPEIVAVNSNSLGQVYLNRHTEQCSICIALGHYMGNNILAIPEP
jgi:hypothetical protein